ncbi:MAG: LysM peptidoglycan-binding domain-containing protein [Anaerolineaceae bacterium]|nr:LysM peptidoglycan-binding domain-containing protein [Anaerolineaceae bacterium]
MKRLTLSFFVWLLLITIPAQAQGTNLLTNPGFEDGFIAVGGDQTIQVATGWSPWHVSGGGSLSENVQPEYYKASDFVTAGQGVARIHGGAEAQQYLTSFATFDGGIFQRVTGITSGAELKFTALIYVWSTTFDDVNLSDRPGDVVVQIGIDPTGGTDGESGNIIWSAPVIQYDAYNEYQVTATAGGSAVTVFIRGTITSPVKSTNVYVDDTSLAVVGSVQPASATPTNTPTATNTVFVPSATPTLTNTPIVVPSATESDLGIVTPPTEEGSGPTPTHTLTFTPLPPSFTPVPPSATFTFTPSFTPSVTFTVTPTAEVLVATNTFTPTATLLPDDTGIFHNNIVHIVQNGDTVGAIARLYGSTIDAIITKNGLDESALIRVGQSLLIPVTLFAPATSTPTPTPIVTASVATSVPVQPTSTVYVVQPGDTLFRIALRFNTTATTLAQLNGITNMNVIRVGQQLTVPGAGAVVTPPPVVTVLVPVTVTPVPPVVTTYVVRAGDTLYRISLRTGVPLNTLIQVNGIVDPNRLFVGQVLTIP